MTTSTGDRASFALRFSASEPWQPLFAGRKLEVLRIDDQDHVRLTLDASSVYGLSAEPAAWRNFLPFGKKLHIREYIFSAHDVTAGVYVVYENLTIRGLNWQLCHGVTECQVLCGADC